jgi:fermentation-respiration switch protein FrsA (DUF1100 family)
MRWWRVFALAAVAIALVALAPRIRVGWLAAKLLYETANPRDGTTLSQLRAEPIVEVTEFEVGGVKVAADLYRPAGHAPHPGILLVHGMVDVGRSDERLMGFADALARAGYVVLVPDFEGLKEFRVSLDDVGTIVAAFERLETLPGVRRDRTGIFGASYSGGLALLAAGDPAIADRVRFCFLLGAYHDLRNVVAYMTTGYYRDGGQWVYLEPENFGRWVFLLNGDDLVDDPADRATLVEIALAKLGNPDGDVSTRVSRLGDEGRRVYDLITAKDPDAALAMIDALAPRVRENLDRLSPRGTMSRVKADLILVHGRDDNMIPYPESSALAAEAAPGTRVHLELLDSFRHVDLLLKWEGGVRGAPRALAEIGRLYSVAWDLVAEGFL